jgi:hypothetical protein
VADVLFLRVLCVVATLAFLRTARLDKKERRDAEARRRREAMQKSMSHRWAPMHTDKNGVVSKENWVSLFIGLHLWLIFFLPWLTFFRSGDPRGGAGVV